MSKPYASVIIPVFNRTSTLRFAIRSVQNQTVEDIEIVIVMDGAVEECKSIVSDIASTDSRFVIHDLPKGRGAGKDNLDYAVRQTKSDKIFYSDDDDLLLDNHIEILGDALDCADIVDSRVCSVGRDGGLHLSPAKGSNSLVRSLLATGQLKILFDTHIAHRRSAYDTYAKWGYKSNNSLGPVWDFFAGFAESKNCQWSSVEQVTALSLHGAARRDLSEVSRKTEIQQLSEIVRDQYCFEQIQSSKSITYYLFMLLLTCPPKEHELDTYLTLFGGYNCLYISVIDEGLFDVFRGGHEISLTMHAEIVAAVSGLVVGGYLSEPLAAVYVDHLGLKKTLMIVEYFLETGLSSELSTGMLTFCVAVIGYSDNFRALNLLRSFIDGAFDPLADLSNLYELLKAREMN